MTPEYRPGSPEEMESRITALLLGELPEAEAAEVRAAVKRDPELARLCQRLKATIELVRQAAAPAEPTAAQATPLRLSDARRQQVLQSFKTIAPREFAANRREKTWSLLIPLAAMLMFLFAVALFLPALGGSKRKAQLAAAKFSGTAATRSETLADNFAVLPLARRGTEESLQSIAPAQQADQTRTWSMKSAGAGQNVRSLDVVGYANV